MPDGIRFAQEPDPVEERALAADARLVHGVRWRLVAWSGGTTLVILLALGLALYVGVARTLESSGVSQLEARADAIRQFVESPRGRAEPLFGFMFGGGSSGTFAMIVDRAGRPIIGRAQVTQSGLPDEDSVAAAANSGRDVRLTSVESVPLRVLTERVSTPIGDVFVQVVGDRTAEQRTLAVMVTVLGVGGLIVVLVAFGFGAIYARRALVPIRESLTSQRAALRRQREFAADASHELRAPLAVIQTSVEDLRRHGDEPVAAVGSAIDDIGAEVERLTALVDDLLLLARSDSGAISLARQPVDLGDVAAEGSAALVKPAGAKDVRIVVDPEPAMLLGDSARLRQLVLILVDNAVRHTRPGGEVRVRVRSDGREASLDVLDEGPGIRSADMPRVFERFWRAAGSTGGGTGLGLAIAASIVGLHGGRIGISNRPEGGACFTVRLPIGDPATAGPSPTAGRRLPDDRPSVDRPSVDRPSVDLPP